MSTVGVSGTGSCDMPGNCQRHNKKETKQAAHIIETQMREQQEQKHFPIRQADTPIAHEGFRVMAALSNSLTVCHCEDSFRYDAQGGIGTMQVVSLDLWLL